MKKQSFCDGWSCNGIPVTLPHDAQIREKRSPEVSSGGHAYFPGGVYIYEKRFIPPAEWKGKDILIEFEGVYKNSTVSLNGQTICTHKYGYTGFFTELKDLRYGVENVLSIAADNSKIPNSRWYTGAGIYRPVWLYLCEPGGLRPEMVKICTVSCNPAVIRVTSDIPVRAEVEEIKGEGTDFLLTIPDARLWSDEHPELYNAKITSGEKDTIEVRFGIRTIEWSPNGLFINGKETLLRGGCIHHDSGILGAATYDESEERRVRIMKEAGFNAIRSAHNPASRALLEACDRHGMYVIDETFDMWYNRKNPFDYGLDYEENWRTDTAAMVNRDFNHPSVIMYSIGNEVAEPFEQKGIDAGKRMIGLCHQLDPSRPVTCGVNLMILAQAAKGKGIYQDGKQTTGKKAKEKQDQNASLSFNIMASFVGSGMNNSGNSQKTDALAAPFADSLDIVGYNYGSGRYPLDGKQHPDRVIFGSETFPQDIWKNWQMVKKYPYLVGDFMWTAWDYLGEAGLGVWSYTGGLPFNRPYPWILAGAGVIDILGIPDGSCRYAAVVWGKEKDPVIAVKPVNHPGVRPSRSVWRGTNAIESWAWNGCEGNRAEIEVYSNADSVELQLNGKRIGRKKVRKCRAVFRTKYTAGTLTAIACDASGGETGRSFLKSSNGTISISIKPEKRCAVPGEVVYVPVVLAGENSVVESNADRRLTVTVKGGELLAFGSADPCTEEAYNARTFTTYYGRALAVIRAGNSEKAVITVSDGIDVAESGIEIRKL